MTDEERAELWKEERERQVDDARRNNPVERIADALEGCDYRVSGQHPPGAAILRIADSLADIAHALDEIARQGASPGWKTLTEIHTEAAQRRLDAARKLQTEQP